MTRPSLTCPLRRSALPTILACAALAGCQTPAAAPDSPAAPAAPGDAITLPSGLVIENLRLGTGAVVLPDSLVKVRYRATLDTGEVFDETADDETRSFELGRLIEGWRQGLVGMRVGGVRRLVVPPSLAYGRAGYAPLGVPSGAELTFEIELVGVETPARP